MDHRISPLSKISAIALVAGISACGGSRQQANAPPPPTSERYGSAMGQPPQLESGASETPSTDTSVRAPGSAPRATEPSDETPPMGPNSTAGSTNQMGVDTSGFANPQVAAVLRAIHQGEVQEAQLAQTKAVSDDVKRFVRHAIATHSERLRREDSLFSRLQLTPNDNAVSNQLGIESQSQMAVLRTVHGLDFDRNYIDAEIRSHQRALELIDRLPIAVQDSDLKAELSETRKAMEQELASAKNLLPTLARPRATPRDQG